MMLSLALIVGVLGLVEWVLVLIAQAGGGGYWLLPAGLPIVVSALVWGVPRLALVSCGAKVVVEGRHGDLVSVVERLSALAGIAAPRVAISKSWAPTAFAIGISPKGSTIVVTRGLIELLTPQEVEAVLAHEVTHVANRDSALLTVAGSLSLLAAAFGAMRFGRHDFTHRKPDILLEPRDWFGMVFIRVTTFPLYVLGVAATLIVARTREHVADRGAAVLTGAPEQLMSALQKVADPRLVIPERDLRLVDGAGGLSIVPPPDAHWTLAW
jgi:heat shock protein HtpX